MDDSDFKNTQNNTNTNAASTSVTGDTQRVDNLSGGNVKLEPDQQLGDEEQPSICSKTCEPSGEPPLKHPRLSTTGLKTEPPFEHPRVPKPESPLKTECLRMKDDPDNVAAPETRSINTERKPLPVKPDPDVWNDENRSEFPSFRFMKIRKRLGLCAADHPQKRLTPSQLKTLEEEILELVAGPEGRRAKPRFYGIKTGNGYLAVICGDYTTLSWVRGLPDKLHPDGIRLKVIEDPYEDQKTFVVVGRFQKSEFETNERILTYLENQNEGLDCSQWRVLDRNYEKKSVVRLTFSVDWASAQKLKTKGPLLSYKFGKAQFQTKTKKGINFLEEDLEEECMESLDSFLKMANGFGKPFVKREAYSVNTEPHSVKTEPYSVKTEPFSVKTEPYSANMGPYSSDWGSHQTHYGFPLLDYDARVADVVEKSRSTLKFGLSSRERYWSCGIRGKRFRKKKKKKIKAENEVETG